MNSKMIPVAVINPDAPSDCLEAKQPEIDNGTAVYDKSGYFSSGFMAQEWDRIWTRSWLLAGVLSDIPETGDYFLFRIRHESFIVSRTEAGVSAFYNVCPHRGSRLLTEARGNKKVFVCPFHSWSFAQDGSLRSITDEDTFKPEVVSHRRRRRDRAVRRWRRQGMPEVDRKWELNRFLQRWLGFCHRQGHLFLRVTTQSSTDDSNSVVTDSHFARVLQGQSTPATRDPGLF